MLHQIILLLIPSLLLFQSARLSTDDQLEGYEDAEAYEVYAAILPSGWPWSVAKAKRLVILSKTSGNKMCLEPEKEYEELVGPAIAEYVRLNKKAWLLQKNIQIEKPYDLITSDELKLAFGKEGTDWESFYKQHPGSSGFIALSAVGFNADKTVAVVYMGHHCGNLCGEGRFYVLQKKDGKWSPLDWKGKSCSWAS